jgi:DNA repair ATPase RecN
LAEIARMLSGETTGISLEHAATLVALTRRTG